ncbi:MAG: glycosyltransferase [Opitutae bacterium]|jgi:glycosyltransferase involved in cell wall biosynthesis|nr:glycosyltransferase [Opitutae bacterium]
MGSNRSKSTTILIPARNAVSTIERALKSTIAERPESVLLLDHGSKDDTVSVAREIGGDLVRIIDASSCSSLGEVRQQALQSVETEYGIWLDADDAFIPGRVSRLIGLLDESGSDLAFDQAILLDQTWKHTLSKLRFPPFITEKTVCRIFERNYLPSHWPAFRSASARKIAFDPSPSSCEDYDFHLRAFSCGLRFIFDKSFGYFHTDVPNSLSRNITFNEKSISVSLKKHSFDSIKKYYDDADISKEVRRWAIVLIATQRKEYRLALKELSEIAPSDQILEPEGPFPFPENWRVAFHKGVLSLLAGDPKLGEKALLEAISLKEDSPETLNNLGVAYRIIGKNREAVTCFDRALVKFPQYSDARANQEVANNIRITKLPIRIHSSRSAY